METKGELAKAIIAVMKDVTNIEKNLTVGAGSSSYKGVSDKDVKIIVGNAIAKHGLCIMPIEIDSNTTIERWNEVDQYSKETPKATKIKQSVFTEATCKYLLLHTSGESQVLAGLGHGVDTQDKSAGKATTYSLKNVLLATFMIPTGEIDDADKHHSDTLPTPQNMTTEVQTILDEINTKTTIETLGTYYKTLSKDQQQAKVIAQAATKRKLELTT